MVRKDGFNSAESCCDNLSDSGEARFPVLLFTSVLLALQSLWKDGVNLHSVNISGIRKQYCQFFEACQRLK